MAIKTKKARVLKEISVEGILYSPDSVIEADERIIDAFESQGAVDSHKDAVKYCFGELGIEVTTHVTPVEEVATEEVAKESV